MSQSKFNSANWNNDILSKLSDREICIALAHLQSLAPVVVGASVIVDDGSGNSRVYDPLSNKSQAFELVMKCGIKRGCNEKGFFWQVVDGEFNVPVYEQSDSADEVSDPDVAQYQCFRAICQTVLVNYSSPDTLTTTAPRAESQIERPFSCINCQSQQLTQAGRGYLAIGEYDEASGRHQSEGELELLECKNCGTVCAHIDQLIPNEGCSNDQPKN